jgi:hypothetical protein
MKVSAFVQPTPPSGGRPSGVPTLLVRDLVAVGLLTVERPSARSRLEAKVGRETATALRRAVLVARP